MSVCVLGMVEMCTVAGFGIWWLVMKLTSPCDVPVKVIHVFVVFL